MEGSRGENVHGVASVGPVTLTKTIKLYSRLDNFDYILRAWNRMEKSTLLQREPGWNRRVQRWVTLVEREPSIFSVKQRDTACSRLNHADLTNSAVHKLANPHPYPGDTPVSGTRDIAQMHFFRVVSTYLSFFVGYISERG